MLEIILGAVTFIALGLAIYQTIQAKKSDDKLQETKDHIQELEDGMLLSNFKLKKAVEYYEDGHFKNSLEAFKKYANETEDSSEFFEAIKSIFWKETRKIYSKYMNKGWTPSILVLAIITRRSDIDLQYPDFILNLCELYLESTGKNISMFLVPIHLNREEYESVSYVLPNFKAQYDSKLANRSFRDFVTNYCTYHIQQIEQT